LTQKGCEKCDALLAIAELTTALQNSDSGRSPRLDGLTYELNKKFWNELGSLMLRVANTGIQEEKPSPSMLNGIITLIPIKGDLPLLSNWRHITLLNTDYKLITRCPAKRIVSVLPDLITTDQSYCIPNRTIHTNLHLIRDSIDHANQHDLPLAVISLDQVFACDCVEHPYILRVLKILALARLLSKTHELCTAMHRDCSRRPSNVEEEHDKETPSLGHCSPLQLNPSYYCAPIIFETMDLKYHPPSTDTGHQGICRSYHSIHHER
jgi:hypothetical protein